MSKKVKGWWNIIEFPVFSNYTVHVVVSDNLKEAVKRYKHTKHVGVDDTTAGLCVYAYGITYMFIKPNSSIGEVVHECWHAVRRMMQYVGVDVDSETVAYHLGYLAQKVLTDKRIPWGKEKK